MWKLLCSTALLTTLAFLPATLPAASAGAEAALIQDRYSKTNSFEAGFEQTLTQKESGAVEKRKGILLFQKPFLARWRTDKPHEEVLVINDKEIWDYIPDEEIAYRYPPSVAHESAGIIQALTGQARLTKDFDIKKAGTENGLVKLRLFPKEPTTQLVEAMIWMEPATGYIKRAQSVDFYGNSNDVNFVAFTPNVKLPPASFTFTPPEGVEVEDRAKAENGKLF